MAAAAAAVEEHVVLIPSGISIACRVWNPTAATNALLVHGWLDNSSSWDVLLPLIVAQLSHIRFVAIDLPGHGRSSHTGRYDVTSDASSVVNFINVFFGSKSTLHLLGHSLGGTAAQITAAVLGARVRSLLLFDSMGPFCPSPTELVATFKAAVEGRAKRTLKAKREYESIAAAADHYRSGNARIERENAIILMTRGTVKCNNDSSSTTVQFAHDSALQTWFMSLTEPNWLAYIAHITCHVTHIMAAHEEKIAFDTAGVSLEHYVSNWHKRIATYKSITLKRLTAGANHHAHMDRPAEVAGHVLQHFEEYAQRKQETAIAAHL